MPQKHDIGWQKRHKAAVPTSPIPNGGLLARLLVERGLASLNILDHYTPPKKEQQP